MKRRSLFIRKQILAYSMVFTVVVGVFLGIFYNYVYGMSKKMAAFTCNELAIKTLRQLEAFLDDMDYIAYQVMTSPDILNVYNRIGKDGNPSNYFEEDILTHVDVVTYLTTLNAASKLMWRVAVYNDWGDYISVGAITKKKTMEMELRTNDISGWMRELSKEKNKRIMVGGKKDRWAYSEEEQFVIAMCPLMNIYSDEVYGVVEVQRRISELINMIQFNRSGYIDMVITDSEGNTVVDLTGAGTNKEEDSRISLTSQTYGWTVTLLQSEEMVMAPYRSLIYSVSVGAVAILAIMIGIIVLIAKRIGKPFLDLKGRVEGLNILNLEEDYESDSSLDEMIELNNAFDTMLERMRESIRLEKKASLLALQAQMNPHFLYNSLAIMSAAASEVGDKRVITMCEVLSDLLRYAASYEDHMVTLADEMDNVEKYLMFMKWRYEDFFDYTLEIAPTVKNRVVPKLVLQPLVENCFEHGFKDKEPPYHIAVEIGEVDNRWYMLVKDNGMGISGVEKDAIVHKITHYFQEEADKYVGMQIGGLGLSSTLIRLQLALGESMTYEIGNNEQGGFTIRIEGEK